MFRAAFQSAFMLIPHDTQRNSLGSSGSPPAMAAGRTRLRRVAGSTSRPGSRPASLVGEEAPELRERPAAEPLRASLPQAGSRSRMPPSLPPRSRARCLWQSGRSLADAVVLMAAEPGLLARDPLELLLRPPGAPSPGAASSGGCASCGSFRRACRNGLRRRCRRRSWRCRDRPRRSRWPGPESLRGPRRSRARATCHPPQHEVGSAPWLREPLGLVLPHQTRGRPADRRGQQAHAIRPLEAHHPRIEGHRGVIAERGPFPLSRLYASQTWAMHRTAICADRQNRSRRGA